MDGLPMAVALALFYLDRRQAPETEDDDIRAIEEIMSCLHTASAEDKEAVAQALRDLDAPELIEGIGL